MPFVVTVIASVVAPLLHKNVAPGAPVAVNSELPQLLVTDTPGAAGIGLTVNVAALEVAVPAMLVHTARYCLLLSAAVVVNDKSARGSPGYVIPARTIRTFLPLHRGCRTATGC